MVFGGSVASDGAGLLAELGLPPLKLKPQCSLSVPLSGRGSVCRDDEKEPPPSPPAARFHPPVERALLTGLWLLTGLLCAFMAMGTVVEFERGNYARSFTCSISAAAASTGLIAYAVNRWLKHYRSKSRNLTAGILAGLEKIRGTNTAKRGAVDGGRNGRIQFLERHP
jgi:hypothetical protein